MKSAKNARWFSECDAGICDSLLHTLEHCYEASCGELIKFLEMKPFIIRQLKVVGISAVCEIYMTVVRLSKDSSLIFMKSESTPWDHRWGDEMCAISTSEQLEWNRRRSWTWEFLNFVLIVRAEPILCISVIKWNWSNNLMKHALT